MKKLILMLLFIPMVIGAATIENPIKSESFTELFEAIIKWITDIALVIAPLIIVYGGFLHITSAGDPAKSSQEKSNTLCRHWFTGCSFSQKFN
jgi:hypothetical protein